MEVKQDPLVSIIVPTRNEELNIGKCLASIKEQTYKNVEIIVVDNRSEDSTQEVAKSFGAKVLNFGNERSEQRNAGAMKAQGKYVIYLDADMSLSRNVIHECVNACEKENKLVGLYIPEKIIGEGFWIKVRDYERSFYDATPIDSVRFVKRDAFLMVKGFDEELTGPEDWDFDKKIRKLGQVAKIQATLFHNEGSFNLSKYLSKKIYYARSMHKYKEKWGKYDKDIKKQLSFLSRYFSVFVENGKWKKCLKHPILCLSMFYLRFRVGLSYIFSGT